MSPWAVCLWLQWNLLSHCRLNPPDWFCWPAREVQDRSIMNTLRNGQALITFHITHTEKKNSQCQKSSKGESQRETRGLTLRSKWSCLLWLTGSVICNSSTYLFWSVVCFRVMTLLGEDDVEDSVWTAAGLIHVSGSYCPGSQNFTH